MLTLLILLYFLISVWDLLLIYNILQGPINPWMLRAIIPKVIHHEELFPWGFSEDRPRSYYAIVDNKWARIISFIPIYNLIWMIHTEHLLHKFGYSQIKE